MRGSDEIPGPPPANSVFAAYRLMQAVRSDLLGLLTGAFREHGDLVKLEVLGRKQILCIAPADVRRVLLDEAASYEKGRDYTDPRKGLAKFAGQGLVVSNGDFWKRQRRLVAPALHKKRIASYGDAMTSLSAKAIAGWKDGSELAIDDAMTELTLDIVARALFSTDIGEDAHRIADAMLAAHGMLEANNSAWTILPSWMWTPQRGRENRAVRTLDEIVYGLIRARRPTPESPVDDTGDLTSMLLSAEDDDGKRMSDREARDEIVTMFLAGHETTANSMAWLWALVSASPESERKLHAELDAVLGRGVAARAPTMDDLDRLPYVDAIVKETLRLYPAVFTFMRSCIADTTLGDFAIPKGMDVSLVPYATHRDARFFPEPDTFRPERFLPPPGSTEPPEIDRYAYIPFGGGARICVGNVFALVEMKMMLATIASRFRIVVDAKPFGVHPVEPVPGVTLRAKPPLRAKLVAR